jgi:hypothetical protein
MEARQSGRIQEAVDIVRGIPAFPGQKDKPLEDRVMEGEMLLLAGRHEEARQIFEKARAEAPEDLEIQEWAQRAAAQPPPIPREPHPRPGFPREAPGASEEKISTPLASPPPIPPTSYRPPEPERAERPEVPAVPEEPISAPRPPSFEGQPETSSPSPVETSPEAAPPGGFSSPREEMEPADICQETMCDTLFDPKLLSLDTSRIFDERYKGKVVVLNGRLKSVEPYPFDFVFGDKPGTKATFEVHEVEGTIFGKRKISAVVQLGPEAHELLIPLIGQQLSFTGRLHSVDGFVQNIFVTAGRLRLQVTSECR